jgi:hypothetical protein
MPNCYFRPRKAQNHTLANTAARLRQRPLKHTLRHFVVILKMLGAERAEALLFGVVLLACAARSRADHSFD